MIPNGSGTLQSPGSAPFVPQKLEQAEREFRWRRTKFRIRRLVVYRQLTFRRARGRCPVAKWSPLIC